MQRHLFLFEKGMILCKRVEQAPPSASDNNSAPKRPQPRGGATADKISYQFKNRLNMATVGLTENVQSDKRKLELWQNQRAEVWILQAPSAQTKDQWVKEIKDVLLRQFDEIKASHHSLSRLPKVRDLAVVPASSSSSSTSLFINPALITPATNATTTTTTTNSTTISTPGSSSPKKELLDVEETPILPVAAQGHSFAPGGVIRREPASISGVVASPVSHSFSPYSPPSSQSTSMTTTGGVTHRHKKLKPKTSWTSGAGVGASRRYSGNASVGSVGSGGSRPSSADYNEYLMMHGGSTTSSTWSSGDEYDEEDEDKQFQDGDEFDEVRRLLWLLMFDFFFCCCCS